MDPSGRHVRSRTSSTSSLRSPSALGSGVPPATPSHTPNTATISRSSGLSAASSFGFNNVSPDQLAAGLFRVRAEQGGSRASSIPPTPAPTPNPLLQVNHHMVPEQLGKCFQVWLHTIRKLKFLSKNSIMTKLCNFLGKSKLSTAKKPQTAAFSRFCTQNNSTIFLGKSKLSFWTKK